MGTQLFKKNFLIGRFGGECQNTGLQTVKSKEFFFTFWGDCEIKFRSSLGCGAEKSYDF